MASPLKTEPAQSIVALRDVGKWYTRGTTKTYVLHSIDLDVRAGECVCLLGPSGSGKTTLLSIIGCVLTPDRGSVRILGSLVNQLQASTAAELRLRHIGFVFQRFHLIRGLTAAENVAVPLTLQGWPVVKGRRRAMEALDLVGLSDKATDPPSQLSVGQCQRVALARALVADPELILADEPTASLDAECGQQAMQLLRKLTVDTGKAVVIVTHDQRILPYADRILEIENGILNERSPHPNPCIKSHKSPTPDSPIDSIQKLITTLCH